MRVEAAGVPLDEALEQRAGAVGLPTIAQPDCVEDWVGRVGVLTAGEQLLELELQTRAAGDHVHEAHLEHPVRLPPVLVGERDKPWEGVANAGRLSSGSGWDGVQCRAGNLEHPGTFGRAGTRRGAGPAVGGRSC